MLRPRDGRREAVGTFVDSLGVTVSGSVDVVACILSPSATEAVLAASCFGATSAGTLDEIAMSSLGLPTIFRIFSFTAFFFASPGSEIGTDLLLLS